MSTPKISDTYKRRLGHLASHQYTRAIVLLKASAPQPKMRGLSTAKREELLSAQRNQMRGAIAQIDAILSQFGGTRLSSDANVLGTIAIETTPTAVIALSQLDVVDAIIEDQAVSNLD